MTIFSHQGHGHGDDRQKKQQQQQHGGRGGGSGRDDGDSESPPPPPRRMMSSPSSSFSSVGDRSPPSPGGGRRRLGVIGGGGAGDYYSSSSSDDDDGVVGRKKGKKAGRGSSRFIGASIRNLSDAPPPPPSMDIMNLSPKPHHHHHGHHHHQQHGKGGGWSLRRSSPKEGSSSGRLLPSLPNLHSPPSSSPSSSSFRKRRAASFDSGGNDVAAVPPTNTGAGGGFVGATATGGAIGFNRRRAASADLPRGGTTAAVFSGGGGGRGSFDESDTAGARRGRVGNRRRLGSGVSHGSHSAATSGVGAGGGHHRYDDSFDQSLSNFSYLPDYLDYVDDGDALYDDGDDVGGGERFYNEAALRYCDGMPDVDGRYPEGTMPVRVPRGVDSSGGGGGGGGGTAEGTGDNDNGDDNNSVDDTDGENGGGRGGGDGDSVRRHGHRRSVSWARGTKGSRYVGGPQLSFSFTGGSERAMNRTGSMTDEEEYDEEEFDSEYDDGRPAGTSSRRRRPTQAPPPPPLLWRWTCPTWCPTAVRETFNGDGGAGGHHHHSRRLLFEKPSWNRVSSFVVRNAPCFWCCANPLETSATDRAILFRLNILCAVFALVQMGVGMFASIVLMGRGESDDEEERLERQSLAPNLWNLNGSLYFLAFVAVVLFVTMMATLRVIREVRLIGAVRYMWALLWLIPLDIFFVISLFDYHRVTDVWVKHWWVTPTMSWCRELFCAYDTANTRCAAPELGGPHFESVEEWCIKLYNMTDCEELRDDAQLEVRAGAYIFFTVNAIWGLLLVVLLLLALNMLESIITSPIVQSSKEANVPAWLTLPIVGCLASGSILLFSPSSVASESESDVFWIGMTYMVSAGTFTLAAVLGWFISAYSVLNSRDKKRKQIAVLLFIATMVLTIFSVAAIFAASLIYSVNLVDIDDDVRGQMACFIDTADSCSDCDDPDPIDKCPEWSSDDVARVLQTQLKQSATLAAIFLIYAFSALRFGFVLRSHVMMYQIDYV